MSPSKLLNAVKLHASPGQITGTIHIPGRAASNGQWPTWMNPQVKAALTAQGIESPWLHQAQTCESIHAGCHTVIATGTGSGKSLAAWAPLLSDLVDSHSSQTSLASMKFHPTALYLSPTKALANDQLHAISELAAVIDPQISAACVDGDADGPERRWAREYANIILTNPDFAHHAMLAGQQRWTRLWRGLSMIIVDEFHNYRGVFGSHVALTVRRLLRVAKHYGANPVVVFLSATSGDPGGSAARFLGIDREAIVVCTEDSSPRGAQDIVLWQCREIVDENSQESKAPREPIRRAANTEAGELTGVLVEAGAHSLTFVRSRPGTESVAEVARDWLAEHNPTQGGKVAAYRGGYLPEERRELEHLLRSGQLRALACTNALELGIDIAGLDAVVVTGWPGTHASFSQQIGRAGRAGSDGLAVFVGRDNPLDQYMLTHPEEISEATSEVNVFDPENPNVLIPHICAAASELALTAADAATFGQEDTQLFDTLAAEGFLRKRPTGWFWNPQLGHSAHAAVNLRGDGSTVSIVDSASGGVLGLVNSGQADTSVYPGAIYIHQGVAFEVEELTADVALVHRHREEDIRTYARKETNVEIIDVVQSRKIGNGRWELGKVLVTSRVVGYDIRRHSDGLYMGMVPLSMPLRQLETVSSWWTFPEADLLSIGVERGDIPGALHGAEHASIGVLPLFATCDRWDLGGLSTAIHPQTGQPTVFVHDALHGGSGCAERGFEAYSQWMKATKAVIESCECQAGCPRCIQSPKCGNNNDPLSKDGALRVLSLLCDEMAAASAPVTIPDF